MKFKFDNRTGTMQPQEDKKIYLAKSQGGGLRIDDDKHNIRYVIERDGRITNIAGVRDEKSLNVYDMMDARTISNRVMRMFGKDHKFTDFHRFLRGYRVVENVVKTFEEFVEEGVLSDIVRRSAGNAVRKEDGFFVGYTHDGKKMICSNNDSEYGEQAEFNNGEKTLYIEGLDMDLICLTDEKDEYDHFFMFDKTAKGKSNMVRVFGVDDGLRKERNMEPLLAIVNSGAWHYGGSFDIESLAMEMYSDAFTIYDDYNKQYDVFWDYKKAKENALDKLMDMDEFGDVNISEDDMKKYLDSFGDDILNIDAIEDDLKIKFIEDFEDLCGFDEESAIKKLIEFDVVKETDITEPKFNAIDFSDDYAEAKLGRCDNIVSAAIDAWGYDFSPLHINKEILFTYLLNTDDEDICALKKEKVNDTTYYILKID